MDLLSVAVLIAILVPATRASVSVEGRRPCSPHFLGGKGPGNVVDPVSSAASAPSHSPVQSSGGNHHSIGCDEHLQEDRDDDRHEAADEDDGDLAPVSSNATLRAGSDIGRRVLSRQRRYVVFPRGSSIQVGAPTS